MIIEDHVIRFATSADAEQIAACHIASWQKAYRGSIPDAVLDHLSLSEITQKWRDHLNDNVPVLVLEQKHINGFASLCAARDTDMDTKRFGEISTLYLHPDIWHKGFGKKLCQAAFLQLKVMGFNDVIVWVLKENSSARSFYSKMGFHDTGLTKLVRYNDDVVFTDVKYQKKLI